MRLWLLGMFAVATVVSSACAPTLAAPPHLISAWPSANATVPLGTHTVELMFNRVLDPETTWATVWRDEDDAPVTSQAIVDTANARRLRVTLVEPMAGQYRLRWHAVSARTTGIADGEQTFSIQAESIGAPRLQVSRSVAETGDLIQITGAGFGPTCQVRLSMGDDDQALPTVHTDARGGFVVEARVPAGIPFGVQPVVAVDSWGETATATVQVRWGGWPPLVAFTTGQPGPRPTEVTFTLSVRNRSDYLLEQVHVLMTMPQDSSVIAAQPPASRQDGGIAWDIPLVDRGVVGPFRMTLRVNGPTATHASIQYRHRRPRGCYGDDCLPAFVSETTSDSTVISPAD